MSFVAVVPVLVLLAVHAQSTCLTFCDEHLLEVVRLEVREDMLSLGLAPDRTALTAALARNFNWSLCTAPSAALLSSSPSQSSLPEDEEDASSCWANGAGTDIEQWSPPDWEPVLPALASLADAELREWSLQRVHESVRANPERHSLMAAPHPFIAPGGRFREFYYWDTYWIIRGLFVSQMHETALGMVRNMLWAQRELGLVPNGARSYYTTRSQPPMLTLMVEDCCNALDEAGRLTDATTLLHESLPVLMADYEWWMKEPRVVVVADRAGRNHTLNRYYALSDRPRPEGYAQDVEVAREVPPEKRGALWREIATMAFSGLDFSSRWLEPGKGLASARATRIVPVDLNSIMHAVEQAMSRIAARCNRSDLSSLFASRALARDTLPQGFVDPKVVVAAIRRSGVLEYPGGVPSSTVQSGQQWDFPNVWAPQQWFVVKSLEAAGEHSAARAQAMKWIRSAHEGWARHGAMFEKYDCRSTGVPGGGGEYPNQVGFGWTNGVTLEFLVAYGTRPGVCASYWILIVLPVVVVGAALAAILAAIAIALCLRRRRARRAGLAPEAEALIDGGHAPPHP
eukprot:m51a1_g10777 putative trehalase isoform x1 (571) ;mRNA; f:29670-31941